MFAVMDEQLLTWAERLDKLNIGQKIALADTDIPSSVYSGARTLKPKKFTIRLDPVSLIKYVIRKKDSHSVRK